MCGKSIDDIRKSLQPKNEETKKEDSILYPGVDDTPVVEPKKLTKKEQKKTLDEIHAFVDKLN
jgi:hypothetical protein